jgi:uncharacterized repeat protein (TIGR01451 family)
MPRILRISATRALTAAALGATLLPLGLFAATAHAETVAPLVLRYQQQVYGDFDIIGNAVLRCPASSANCLAGSERKSMVNNNGFDMGYTQSDPSLGGFDSSSATLTIPDGATIDYAQLSWGGNTGTYKLGRNVIRRCDTAGVATPAPGDFASTPVLLRVGDGTAATPVTADHLASTSTSRGGPHYYTADSDVTKLLQAAPTGTPVTVTAANVWAPTGMGCVGGWGLTYVYRYPGPSPQAPVRREVSIFDGQVYQASNAPATTSTVSGFRATAGASRAGVIAYEGDYGVPGDRFSVNGVNVPEPQIGATNNFFVSDANGAKDPADPNNYSIDAKDFNLPASTIPEGSSSATLATQTRGDTYILQEFALSVPIPDVDITKTATPRVVNPGDTVRYDVTVTNTTDLPYPNAQFSDDLSDLLDNAHYNNDASASLGRLSYAEPRLTWRGDLPPHGTATITYTATLDKPMRGDEKLSNAVLAPPDDDRLSCLPGNVDPNCGSTLAMATPTPPPGTPTASSWVTPTGPAPSGPAGVRVLPNTGFGALPLVGAAAALALAGALLIWTRRSGHARH